MSKKKIEPTDRMVRDVESWGQIMGVDDRDLLRYALNHPDADALFADEDDRPWEPLGEHDPLNVGDEVRQELNGVTTIAVVGRVDVEGDPWAAEDRFIGVHDEGTWYVRRAAQELPEEDGDVIVPAEGFEYIETNEGVANALVHLGGKWYGGAFQINSEQIIPGTWKVDGK